MHDRTTIFYGKLFGEILPMYHHFYTFLQCYFDIYYGLDRCPPENHCWWTLYIELTLVFRSLSKVAISVMSLMGISVSNLSIIIINEVIEKSPAP